MASSGTGAKKITNEGINIMKKRSQKNSTIFSEIFACLILFGIAYAIFDFISPFIPFLIGAAIIIGIGYVILKSQKNQNKKSNLYGKYSPPATSLNSGNLESDVIKRQLEILMESTELVNNSNNLDTVLKRYLIVCDSLTKLSSYTDSEIRNAGYSLKEPLNNTLHFMHDNKTSIINQAIERHVRNDISKLSTVTGKIKKINTLYDKIKKNEALSKDNIVFLEDLCQSLKKELDPNSVPKKEIAESPHLFPSETTQEQPPSPPIPITPDSAFPLNADPEIANLLWIGDGKYKNYSPPEKRVALDAIITFSSYKEEEPSALYLSLPISKPSENALVERPPYFPTYRDLSPEQRWLYWEFLADPFSKKHNVGYAFLFYYGLERHLASGNLEKAFDIILKLRETHRNPSFQSYTSNALILTCIAKQRPDLALKLLESGNNCTYIPIQTEYLLILKYTFQMPLTAPEVIRDYQYFGFYNNRYIKGHPDLFTQTFAELLQRDFGATGIDLNQYFPIDVKKLPVKHERMFANPALEKYEIPVPIFESKELIQKISSLLSETHETVKIKLKELRKQGSTVPQTKSTTAGKLSPIETECIPKTLNFNFSEIEGWETWSNRQILDTFFMLSTQIESGKEILPKLEACEKSYKILKPVITCFTKDPDGLPPVIACRDQGPYLYIKLGDWDNAEKAIKTCIEANAYESPNDGIYELDTLETYKKVGEAAIDFIKKNPGFLQKNIYIALQQQIGEDYIPALKNFMRQTYIFHKEPHAGSNKLFYIERK